jgi:hypothetical protein
MVTAITCISRQHHISMERALVVDGIYAGPVGRCREKTNELSPKVVSRVIATCADETILSKNNERGRQVGGQRAHRLMKSVIVVRKLHRDAGRS